MDSTNRPITVVIGADHGIGASVAEQARRRGDDVLATCLADNPVLAAADVEVLPGVDVSGSGSLDALAARLGTAHVGLVIHVAGIALESSFGTLDFAAMTRQFDVNALGVLRVAEVVAPRMAAGSKFGVVTSRVGSLGDNAAGGLFGYRMSKAAANMAALCLARELAPREVAVLCLHPGTVRTPMTETALDRGTLADPVEPEDAARGILARLDELSMATTGTFRHANGDSLPW